MNKTTRAIKAEAKRLAAKWIQEIKEEEEECQRKAVAILEKWGWA